MAISRGWEGNSSGNFFSQKSFVQVALDFIFGCPSGENSPPKIKHRHAQFRGLIFILIY
jgi:hypothetical protein